MGYILAIDQSTSGTKALLADGDGRLAARCDKAHRQIVDSRGWVEHDPAEIWQNTLAAARGALEKSGVSAGEVAAVGICNQRETALVWERGTGRPVYNAIVWQCARGGQICRALDRQGCAQFIKEITGLPLSPYFSAAKIAWVLQNVPGLAGKRLCAGTMDSWLIWQMTGGKSFCTDYSNASRTQLFDIGALRWSGEICKLFGVEPGMLPALRDSDACFGQTDLGGLLPAPVPIHGVLGDSHGALFGQGCWRPGMIKATYGTGSSVMLHIGGRPLSGGAGLATSIAWRMAGRTEYVLEGNINYTGAVLGWVKGLGLIGSPREAAALARQASPADTTYLVPAFSGLGAPHWDSGAKALLCGMGRATGRAELVRAAEESIAYQVMEVVDLAREAAGIAVQSLRVDGGPTRDAFLMQFQSDILGIPVLVSGIEELSGLGAAYAAGLGAGLYRRQALLEGRSWPRFDPAMPAARREIKINGWKDAVRRARSQC